MSALRAVRKLILGETWLLPAGIVLAFAVTLRLRPLMGHSWDHLGGFVLLAGITAVLLVSVAHSAHQRPRRPGGVTLGLAVMSVALVSAAAWRGGWVVRDAPARERPVTLVTAPMPANRAVVWAVGDGATGSARSEAVARRIAADHPDLLLYLGDVYGGGSLFDRLARDGTRSDFAHHYAPVYGTLARRTAPTPGNHEWALRAEGYRPYWRSVDGRTPSDFYAEHAGGWTLLSLNSETGHDAGSAEVAWLRATLAHLPGTCTLAFWHRPRFSDGGHGDQPDVAPLWDALATRAALVVNAHDHDLQRFVPRDGITELVAGAGGRSHSQLHRDGRLAFGDDTHDGALRLVLTPGEAQYRFVAVDGSVLDAGRVPCASASRRRA